MTFTKRTHAERLQAWAEDSLGSLAGDGLHQRWTSPLLPTRRFGPDAYARFDMHTSPGEREVGEFLSWTVFDAGSVRLIAHLGRPLADTFGVVAPFPKVSFDNSQLESLPALERLASSFFANSAADKDDLEAIGRVLSTVPPSLSESLNALAPDFFGWLRW